MACSSQVWGQNWLALAPRCASQTHVHEVCCTEIELISFLATDCSQRSKLTRYSLDIH